MKTVFGLHRPDGSWSSWLCPTRETAELHLEGGSLGAVIVELQPLSGPPLTLADSQIRSLMKAVRRLVKAELDDQWKGGGNPDDIDDIELELKRAKRGYRKAIERLRAPK